jgi:hydrogenase nickel incorporation protein HypA/HybF
MHEMGIAMEIVNIATDSIPPDMQGARVVRVDLQVGRMSAIVPESLRFCFNIATKDTPLAGAELIIEEIPIEAKCNDCNHHWFIDEPVFVCEKCQSGSINLLSGRELDIKSIEIAEEDGLHDT